MDTQDRFLVRNLSCPFELMRFRLVYSGKLRSSGNNKKPGDARDIRDTLHPQLVELWKVSSTLKRLERTTIVPKSPGTHLSDLDSPFDYPDDALEASYRVVPNGMVDLLVPVSIGGKEYKPLIRRSLGLACSLSIQFFRRDDPGTLFGDNRGDLDGRIATLFDALKIPNPETEARYPSKQKYLYCLLEDDSLITSFEVDSDRLLIATTENPSEVLLIIEVTVNVLKVGPWNACLLGA